MQWNLITYFNYIRVIVTVLSCDKAKQSKSICHLLMNTFKLSKMELISIF